MVHWFKMTMFFWWLPSTTRQDIFNIDFCDATPCSFIGSRNLRKSRRFLGPIVIFIKVSSFAHVISTKQKPVIVKNIVRFHFHSFLSLLSHSVVVVLVSGRIVPPMVAGHQNTLIHYHSWLSVHYFIRHVYPFHPSRLSHHIYSPYRPTYSTKRVEPSNVNV